MPRQPIELGETPSGEGGDSARTAFTRVNEMTAELYAADAALAGRADATEAHAAALDQRVTVQEGHTTDLAANKVDKVAGKGLSANDFTNDLRDKLASIEGSKFQGLFTSLEALAAAAPAGQAGWYAHIDPGTGGEDTAVAIWDVDDGQWIMQAGTGGEMTPAQILAGLLANPDVHVLSDQDQEKLDGVQEGATANASDTQLRDRSTHTGEQPIATVTGLPAALNNRPTADEVPALVLGELPAALAEPITEADQIRQALAKLQAQINEADGGEGGRPLEFDFFPGKRSAMAEACPGFAGVDGQLLSRALYPDAWALIQEWFTVVTDAQWLAGQYGTFSSGDGSTTFRLPDWNGSAAGHVRRVARGTPGDGGGLTEDALQGHTFEFWNSTQGTSATGSNGRILSITDQSQQNTSGNILRAIISDGVHGEPRVDNETRPASIDGVWIVRLANGASNGSDVDVLELASEQAAQGMRISVIEDSIVFSREYESSPQAITNAGSLTLNHGLGGVPKVMQFELHCIAAEAGYSVGDVLDQTAYQYASSTANSRNVIAVKTPTQIYVQFAAAQSGTGVFAAANKTSGAVANLSNASWNLVARAFR